MKKFITFQILIFLVFLFFRMESPNMLSREELLQYQDKVKHYEYCYNQVVKFPKILRPVVAFIIFCGVTIVKEFIHDGLLKKGLFEKNDILANYYGCIDGAKGRKFNFNK